MKDAIDASLPWIAKNNKKPAQFANPSDLLLKGIHIKFSYFFNFALEVTGRVPIVISLSNFFIKLVNIQL